ncbi:MAG: trigger factor [Rickettsiales bacterium]|jgi:trigger factor|nr:trigger factor [Rickettsiales bacterium]
MAQALQIKETENKGLKRAFEIVVPAGEIQKEVGRQLQEVSRNAKIPGFRPGKIPEKVLRQRYGQSVMGDVINKAVNSATQDVLEKHKLTPALQPDVKITKFEDGGDLCFDMNFEIMPDAPVLELSSIEIEKPVSDIENEKIDEALQRIAQNNKDFEDKPEAAKAVIGDSVRIDFKGFIGDEAFEGGEGHDFRLELGSGQFIPGFEEQLVGAKAGDDVTVNVAFPKDYHAEELKGKKTRFEVKVHAVQSPVAPAMDDAFAKSLGMESLDKLKDAVREQIQRDYDTLARNRMKKHLFDALDKKCKFDVPHGMFKLEFDSIWTQVEQAKTQGDPAVKDKSDDDLKKEYEAIADRRVRLGIYLSQTAGRNNLQVDRTDLSKAVMEQARMYPGQQNQIIEFYQKNPEQLAELRGPILEEKSVDFILTQVKLIEKKMTLDALMDEQNSESFTDTPSDEDGDKDKKAASKKTATKKKS